MSFGRAAFRLWIVISLCWVGFWGWNYSTKCIHTIKGGLWCPTVNGATLRHTDILHIAILFLAPLWLLAVGFLGWCAMVGFQRKNEQK